MGITSVVYMKKSRRIAKPEKSGPKRMGLSLDDEEERLYHFENSLSWSVTDFPLS
jgi:hypothetical protein